MDPVVGGLAELPLSEVLERISAPTPAPGGGSTAAVACSLAAALVHMAASLDSTPQAAQIGVQAAALRAEALELADRELDSYTPVLEALRLPADDGERPEKLATACSQASEAPLAIAGTAVKIADLAAEIAASGNPNLAGDAIAGALLAEAACRASVHLVELNLVGVPDDTRLQTAAQYVRHAWQARLKSLGLNADTSGSPQSTNTGI